MTLTQAFRRSRKTVVAVTGASLAWGTIVVQSAPEAITAPEWLAGATLLATALGVYKATNES